MKRLFFVFGLILLGAVQANRSGAQGTEPTARPADDVQDFVLLGQVAAGFQRLHHALHGNGNGIRLYKRIAFKQCVKNGLCNDVLCQHLHGLLGAALLSAAQCFQPLSATLSYPPEPDLAQQRLDRAASEA